jgi:5'-deoxynucleotidase YfbR-like HD superfamily hydrolase
MTDLYLSTISGKKINLDRPEVNEYDIEDIAAGLSSQWRWNGQMDCFFSVAQHSELISHAPEVYKYDALAGLLHDAEEAFIGDLPRPAKKKCPDFVELGLALQKSIFEYYGLQWPYSKAVKEADDRMLVTEHMQLRKKTFLDFENFKDIKPYDFEIVPARNFIKRFEELC